MGSIIGVIIIIVLFIIIVKDWSRDMERKITKSQIKKLEKVTRKIVVQSEFHRANIVEYYRVMADSAMTEFTEDNIPSLHGFLEECFFEALRDNCIKTQEEKNVRSKNIWSRICNSRGI